MSGSERDTDSREGLRSLKIGWVFCVWGRVDGGDGVFVIWVCFDWGFLVCLWLVNCIDRFLNQNRLLLV